MHLQTCLLIATLIFDFALCLKGSNLIENNDSCPISQISGKCTCSTSKYCNTNKNNLRLTTQDSTILLALNCINIKDKNELNRILKFLSNQLKPNEIVCSIDISNSSINAIPWDILNQASNLKFLTIHSSDINSVTVSKDYKINHTLTNSSVNNLDIYNLNISNNKISHIEFDAFHRFKFNSLDLSKNHLKELPDALFYNQTKLVYLSVASNELTSLNSTIFSTLYNLLDLDLSHNIFLELPPDIFIPLQSLQRISLAYNNLHSLQNNFSINRNLTYLNLTGNSWHCDQALVEWAGQWSRRDLGLKDVYCQTPATLANRSLAAAALYAHVTASPTCDLCSCHVQENRSFIEVDCRDVGLTLLPASLPGNTKVVHLEHNQITSLALDHAVEKDWQSVIYLYLDNNSISTLKDIEKSAEVLARNLVSLHLSHNQLTVIMPHLLNLFPNLVEIRLGHNPLECNCNTYQFQTWLQEHFKMVPEISTITCKEDGRPIYRLPKPELCLSQSPSITHYLDVVNTLLGVATIAIAAKLALDFYRRKRTGKLPHFWSFTLK